MRLLTASLSAGLCELFVLEQLEPPYCQVLRHVLPLSGTYSHPTYIRHRQSFDLHRRTGHSLHDERTIEDESIQNDTRRMVNIQ